MLKKQHPQSRVQKNAESFDSQKRNPVEFRLVLYCCVSLFSMCFLLI